MRTNAGWLVIAACAACAPGPARPEPTAVAAPPAVVAAVEVDAAAVDATAIDAPPPPDPTLVAELRALGIRRGDELRAEVPAEATPLDEDDIAALGPCTRPTAAQRAAIATRVRAWILRTNPRALRDREEQQQTLRFGCVERAGMVVDVEAQLELKRGRVGRSWTLRVAPARTAVIADAGCAAVDCAERTDAATVATMVLADLDGDRRLDPVITRDHYDDEPPSYDVLVGSRVVGRFEGGVVLAELQPLAASPPAGERAVVLALETGHDGEVVYRCATTAAAWGNCAAAVRAARRDAAILAADELARNMYALLDDHDELADALDALDVPAADRARFLAAAAPTPARRR